MRFAAHLGRVSTCVRYYIGWHVWAVWADSAWLLELVGLGSCGELVSTCVVISSDSNVPCGACVLAYGEVRTGVPLMVQVAGSG